MSGCGKLCPVKFNGSAGAAALRERDISISEAARRINEAGRVTIERSHLSNVLAGRRGAGADLVREFAELTGMEPMVFVGPDNPREAVIELARMYDVTGDDLEVAAS